MALDDLNELAYIVSQKDKSLVEPVQPVEKVNTDFKFLDPEDYKALKLDEFDSEEDHDFDEMLQSETAKILEARENEKKLGR